MSKKEKEIKELVILSGKGGTGKTTITAAIASLAKPIMLADCDVDAADLHILSQPQIIEKHKFIEGKVALVETDKCTGCGICNTLCRFDAFEFVEETKYQVIESKCEGCGLCVHFCPEKAILFFDRECGHWMKSETRFGSMVHARLYPAGENSGLLVTLVRKKAKEIAKEQNLDLILIDGPPGIGCPVISSVTGATAVLLVTEPSLSGIHDLKRVAALAKNFKIPIYVIVNRSDVNRELTEEIREISKKEKYHFVGTIPFNKELVDSQLAGKTAIEFASESTKATIKEMWEKIWTTI